VLGNVDLSKLSDFSGARSAKKAVEETLSELLKKPCPRHPSDTLVGVCGGKVVCSTCLKENQK